MSEIRALTGVRAYAALWVMVHHLPAAVGVRPHVMLGPLAQHGPWGVDVFFVLSGFILSMLYVPRFEACGVRGAYRDYLAARFARIYPLHIAALLMLAAYVVPQHLFSAGPPLGSFGWRDLALNVLLLHGWGYVDQLSWNFPSWSISTEWFAYLLLMPALALGLRRWHAMACVALALTLWGVLFAVSYSLDRPVSDMTYSWAIPRIVAEFTLGYALFRTYQRVHIPAPLSDALVLLSLSGLAMLCFAGRAAEGLLAPLVALLILGLSRAGPLGQYLFGNRWAVFWGERSYSIYMLHVVVQFYGSIIAIHLGLRNSSAEIAWPLFIALIGAVLLVSHLAYQWIEKPMRSHLRARLSEGRGT